VVAEYSGEVPRTMEEMLTIPGAARKTATWCWDGVRHGVRHRGGHARHADCRKAGTSTKNTDPVKIEQDLMKIIPRNQWIVFATG